MKKKTQVATTSTSTNSSKPKKKINGAKKGKQFEREIANALGHIFPEAERMLEYQASKVVGVDIEGTDRIRIQCKNHQGYASVGTIHEVRTVDPKDVPVLVTKGNRLEAMAVMRFSDFVRFLEIAYGLELPFRSFDLPATIENAKKNLPPYSSANPPGTLQLWDALAYEDDPIDDLV